MLQGNLQAQINYSIVKGIAQAINQKTEILPEGSNELYSLMDIFAEWQLEIGHGTINR